MHSLLTLGLVALDMTGTLRTVGLIGGIVLLVIWWLSVKNTTALFYDKKKIRATILFAVPGLILLVIGIFLFASMKPMSSNMYIANYSSKDGKVEVDGVTHEIKSGTWQMIEVRTKEDSYPIKAYVGDSMVFDTTMGDGSWVGNMSSDKIVLAEEVEYSASSFGTPSSDLFYEMLMSPGIARFSPEIVSDLYDFDHASPETMSVSSKFGTVRKFDLQLLTEAEFLQMMMEAMGKEGMDLDDLDSLGVEEGGGDVEFETPEADSVGE